MTDTPTCLCEGKMDLVSETVEYHGVGDDWTPKSLEGTWKAVLGSKLVIWNAYCVSSGDDVDGCPVWPKHGGFNGVYSTSVGRASEKHNVSGGSWQYCLVDGTPCLLVTFSVQWTKLNTPDGLPSCTCWSAQGVFNSVGTLCFLDSTYILRRYTTAKSGWDQPVVNKNWFLLHGNVTRTSTSVDGKRTVTEIEDADGEFVYRMESWFDDCASEAEPKREEDGE